MNVQFEAEEKMLKLTIVDHCWKKLPKLKLLTIVGKNAKIDHC